MNAHLDYPLDEVMDMSEPAELPDAEEPEADVPLGIQTEEPTIADDIKQDDAVADEIPTSIDSPSASDEDEDEDDDDDEDEDDEEIDEDDEEDFDDDDDEDDEDEDANVASDIENIDLK